MNSNVRLYRLTIRGFGTGPVSVCECRFGVNRHLPIILNYCENFWIDFEQTNKLASYSE